MTKPCTSPRGKAGFTLVEMLATILILVLLVAGMSVGIASAYRIYSTAIFESDSAVMISNINKTLGDILGYAQELRTDAPFRDWSGIALPTGTGANAVNFVFSNSEYGLQQAYFYVSTGDDEDLDESTTIGEPVGRIQFMSLGSDTPLDVINQGVYVNLEVTNFRITYNETGQYFSISYTVRSTQDASKTKDVEYAVRLLNPPS
jgi:prepilin-type N-terminal cleavage/methylation domain-containing protein